MTYFAHRKTKQSGAYCGHRNAFDLQRLGFCENVVDSVKEDVLFVLQSVFPYWSDRMDDVLAGQRPRFRDEEVTRKKGTFALHVRLTFNLYLGATYEE